VLEAIRVVDGGYADDVDEIWVVACSDADQRSRLADRGLDPAEADRRIAAQVERCPSGALSWIRNEPDPSSSS
jgi:dephospho-CoA kinase